MQKGQNSTYYMFSTGTLEIGSSSVTTVEADRDSSLTLEVGAEIDHKVAQRIFNLIKMF